MSVAAVDLINQALAKVGSRKISAIDDTTPGGVIAGVVYVAQRDAELRAHNWNFAMTRVRLGRLAVTPRYEYDYAYALPSDWIRTVSVNDNEAGAGQAFYKQETILTTEAISNGSFATDTVWTKGTGWTISGDKARKATGVGADLSQTATLTGAKVFRVCFLIESMSAGTLTPKFTGGVTVTGTARSVDGYYVEELTADAAGNTTFVLTASSTFNGTVDDASAVRIDGSASPAIMSNSQEIWLRYVRQVTNPDQMDPLFRQVLVLRMADLFSLGVANSSTYKQLIGEDMKTAMRLAKSIDAIEDYPELLPQGSWETSRWGSRRGSWSWGH